MVSTSTVKSIVQLLAGDIQSGKLPPGGALPTHRQLAARHGVAVASASKVYAQLTAMGLVIGETGRGTFVRDRPLQREWDSDDEARLSRTAADLSFNHPTWAGQADLLRTMLRELAVSGDLAALMHQQPPGGRRHEREIVADFLTAERRIQTKAEQVFLVNGAQQGLDVAIRTLLRPHDCVAVDALTYPGFKMAAHLHGLALKPITYHAGGPDLDALNALCRRERIRAIYAMPTLHNPLGWVLTAQQRHQLANIARQHNCMLIEDASYAFLAGKSPPPLATLAPERTIYVSSLSKSLASGLRFGFVVVPDTYAKQFRSVIRATYWSAPSIITAMATRWIASGAVTKHEKHMRADAQQRQAIARKILGNMAFTAHPNALFLWLPLPEDLRADRIAAALAKNEIAVSKAEAYATTPHVPHALRIGLSSVPLAQLEPTLLRLRQTIEQFPV
ncbi:aminotransferase-like domain-containing protein [Neopusillimonas aestuarii]|uniref:aminotransferase-like domain-containing protein n=1 Tax=Neopusillimonas aestuarii TaxID=2716226 RepID=UPI00351B8C5D